MFERVKAGFAFSVPAIFFSYEPRGVAVKAEGAAGSTNVMPEQALPSGLETGSKVLLNYEFRYLAAARGQGFSSSARLAAVLVNISKDEAGVVQPSLIASGQRKP